MFQANHCTVICASRNYLCFSCFFQVYPPLKENERPLTQLQNRLMKKLGQHAYPFYFEVSHCYLGSVARHGSPFLALYIGEYVICDKNIHIPQVQGLIPQNRSMSVKMKLFRGNNSMAQHRQSVTVYPTFDISDQNRGTGSWKLNCQ